MPGKNNTTSHGVSGPVGDGSVGVDPEITSAIGRDANDAASLSNINYQMNTNPSMQNFYSSLMSMVSNWPVNEKLRQIENYGNVYLLGKNVSNEDRINDVLVRTLIQKLPKSEIKKFVSESQAKTQQMVKDIRKANAVSEAQAKRYFNASSIKDFYETTGKYMSNDAQLAKGLKNSFGVKLTPSVKSGVFPKLRKELDSLLKEFTKMDLASTAERMGIDFPDNSSEKSVRQSIINLVLIYAGLVTGKTKGVSHMAIETNAVEEIEDLLGMTSFAWIAGRSVLSAKELTIKQNSAKKAKKVMDANLANAKARERIDIKQSKNGTLKKIKSGSLLHLKEKNRTKVFSSIIKSNKDLINLDIFNGLSDDQIIELAKRFGITDAEGIALGTNGIEDLKNAIATYAGSEAQSIATQYNKANKISNPIKRQKALNDVSARRGTSAISIINDSKKLKQDYSEKVPVVTFNENGKLTSETINKAVPVFLVGTINGGGAIQSREESEKAKANDNINKLNKDMFDALLGLRKKQDEFSARQTNRTNSLSAANITSSPLSSSINSSMYGSMTMNSGYLFGNPIPDKTTTESSNKKKTLTQEQKDAMQKGAALARTLKKENAAKGLVSGFKNDVSKLGYKLYANNKLKVLTNITPVLDINNSHDYIVKMSKTLTEIANTQSDISSTLAPLNTYIAGLQAAGTSVNAAMAGATAGMIETAGIDSIRRTANSAFATGGTMSAKKNISRIVTGDHPKNKNNTELVSVDWIRKNINVKPIPAMATGGNVSTKQKSDNSNVQNVKRMSLSERTKPLSVGIGTGLVNYSKQLDGVTDDGTGTAMKVYSINTGITDKVKVGDASISLFEIVYGVYSMLPTIANGISQGNQLLASISSNTSATNNSLSKLSSNSSSGSGFSFPTNLDSILEGK